MCSRGFDFPRLEIRGSRFGWEFLKLPARVRADRSRPEIRDFRFEGEFPKVAEHACADFSRFEIRDSRFGREILKLAARVCADHHDDPRDLGPRASVTNLESQISNPGLRASFPNPESRISNPGCILIDTPQGASLDNSNVDARMKRIDSRSIGRRGCAATPQAIHAEAARLQPF